MDSKDHDLLIRLDQKMDNLTSEMQLLRDGFSSRLTNIEGKISAFEGLKIQRDSEYKDVLIRLEKLEKHEETQVTKTESNRAYIFRKLFESAIPIVYALVGGLIVWMVKNNAL